MDLKIKIDTNPINFNKNKWDNFVKYISCEVYKTLIKRRWDY